MKPILAACMLLLGGMGALPVNAAGRLADVVLIDRDTGQQLEAHYHQGEYWVAGDPGAHYAIYLHNRTDERLLAITSVDGVNVITGQSAGWDQAGYVFDPWESYQVTGWRKNDYEVAAFAFTAAARSYATRSGRPENVGVIGIALFREQPYSAALPPQAPQIASGATEAAKRAPLAAERAQRETEPGIPPAPESRSSDRSADAVANAPVAPAPALGTAHGEREYSYIARTRFVRRQWQPDEIIRIRHDRLDHLIAMGIVRPYRDQDLRPTPFPRTDTEGYVPDPPPFAPMRPR